MSLKELEEDEVLDVSQDELGAAEPAAKRAKATHGSEMWYGKWKVVDFTRKWCATGNQIFCQTNFYIRTKTYVRDFYIRTECH